MGGFSVFVLTRYSVWKKRSRALRHRLVLVIPSGVIKLVLWRQNFRRKWEGVRASIIISLGRPPCSDFFCAHTRQRSICGIEDGTSLRRLVVLTGLIGLREPMIDGVTEGEKAKHRVRDRQGLEGPRQKRKEGGVKSRSGLTPGRVKSLRRTRKEKRGSAWKTLPVSSVKRSAS